MTHLQILQDLAQDAFKNMISSNSIYRDCAEKILNLKAKYIKSKVLNKSISHNNNIYKAIDVNAETQIFSMKGEDRFEITIILLKEQSNYRNLTNKEKELIKKIYTSSNIEDIVDASYQLKDLKHNIDVTVQLDYSYNFEDILKDNFIKGGLACDGQTILYCEKD